MNDISILEERTKVLDESFKRITEAVADVKSELLNFKIDNNIFVMINNAIAEHEVRLKELNDKIASRKNEIMGLEEQMRELSYNLETQVASINREKEKIARQERIAYLNAFIDSPIGEGTEFNREILKAKSAALNELRSLDSANIANFREKIAKLKQQRDQVENIPT